MSERLVIRTTGQTGPAGSGSSALDDLTDVTITAPSNGQVLKYNGTAWVNGTDSTGAGGGTLDDLTDVTITSAASGDILRHNGTAWVDAVGTTHFEAAGAVAAHEADTTNVHGIADTSALVTTARTVSTTSPLSGGGALSSNLTLSVGAASDTASGVVELATTAETTTGTDTARAVTPSGLAAATTASNINARVGVEKNGTLVAARRNINFIEGSNVTLTVTDDSGNEEVDVTIAASGGGGSSLPVNPLLADSSYSGIPGVAMAPAGSWGSWNSVVGDRAIAGFFVVTTQLTITQAEVRVTTAGTGSAAGRIGIYNCSSAMVPTSLVADFGTVNCSTTGRKTISSLSQVLSPGYYFSYLVVNENLTFEVRTGFCPWAGQNPISAGAQWSGWNGFVATYGALPSTAPTVTSNVSSGATGGINVPVSFRWS